MNAIKNISIKSFLAKQGIDPIQERGGYGMYRSPLRDEQTPSFKVDYNQNLWYDFGMGEGGSVIDLVMRLERCDFREAVDKLENNNSFSFHREEAAQLVPSTMQITSIKPLQDARLVDYLQNKRCIDINIAREYCREVHYTTNGKPFFAIGFQSDGGGWELRNEYFKGSISPKGITTIRSGSPTCMLFEGFMDILSYLTLKKVEHPAVDVVVLNSVNNLNHATGYLSLHQTIHCFLDNDEAGRRAMAAVEKLGRETIDQSPFYRNHKDLNEYVVVHKLKSVQELKEEPKRESVPTPIRKPVLKPKMR